MNPKSSNDLGRPFSPPAPHLNNMSMFQKKFTIAQVVVWVWLSLLSSSLVIRSFISMQRPSNPSPSHFIIALDKMDVGNLWRHNNKLFGYVLIILIQVINDATLWCRPSQYSEQ